MSHIIRVYREKVYNTDITHAYRVLLGVTLLATKNYLSAKLWKAAYWVRTRDYLLRCSVCHHFYSCPLAVLVCVKCGVTERESCMIGWKAKICEKKGDARWRKQIWRWFEFAVYVLVCVFFESGSNNRSADVTKCWKNKRMWSLGWSEKSSHFIYIVSA